MKQAVVSSVIGVAALVAAATSSRGAGYVYFDNYAASPWWPVMYSTDPAVVPPGRAGQGVESTFHANLLYTLGSGNPTQDLGLDIPIAVNYEGYTTLPDMAGVWMTGWLFPGPLVRIPDYVSGSITFTFEAWETTGPYGGATYADSQLRGSLTWTEWNLGVMEIDAGYFNYMPGPIVVALVPEPSTLGTIICGAVTFLFRYRRRKDH